VAGFVVAGVALRFPLLARETGSASDEMGPMTSWAIADYVDGWVDGWTRARGTVRPEPVDGGWYVATGSESEARRFVLSEPTRERLAAILEQGQPPTTCVKLPGEPVEWLPQFGEGWQSIHEGWFMTRALGKPPGRQPPAGYRVELETAPATAIARVLAPEGNVVAWGHVGLGATYAVPDQINTSDTHRRLGLGTVVMAELEKHALEAGLDRAVLGATDDGRALYERLGWDVGAPLAGASLQPG
jgi:GNAT superfamily N-acetyltransferase